MTSLPADSAVAFQGERGAYSEMAAISMFGSIVPVPCRRIADVFSAVESGAAVRGLVPVENSLAGTIVESYDELQRHDLLVVGEVIAPIDHCLLGLPGATTDQIVRVLSHPQALAQCDRFLERLGAEPRATYDTAGSARLVVEAGDPTQAAIASRRAGELYGLSVLARSIQTASHNRTRFWAIGREPAVRGDRNKTVLVFSTRHLPGALYWCLGVFAFRGLNVCKLESRPSRQTPWEYVFYVEVEAFGDDQVMREATAELGLRTTHVSVLGSFPAADDWPVASGDR